MGSDGSEGSGFFTSFYQPFPSFYGWQIMDGKACARVGGSKKTTAFTAMTAWQTARGGTRA
jgi:hypothetical protein